MRNYQIKFLNLVFFALVLYLPISHASLISETYYEVTIPSAWFNDYSKQRMIKLLDEFNKTDSAQEIFNEIRKLEKRPKLNVDIYKDKVDGEINLGWVLRFTISTNEIGLKNSKEVVKKLGTSFGNYIQRYKKEN